MTSGSDKEKKLKEIQKRLAEIQGKTTYTDSTKEKAETKVQVKEETPKKDVAANTPVEPVKSTKVGTQNKQAIVGPGLGEQKSVKPDAKPKKQSSPDPAKGWTENKVLRVDEHSKNKKKGAVQAKSNKSKKILSIVSLLITLFVSSYIIYTFFIQDDVPPNTAVEANVPLMPQDVAAEETPLQEELSSPEEPESGKSSSQPNIESLDLSDRANESRNERSEKIKSKSAKIETLPIQSNKSSVPRGMIISYASNSNENQAQKNVEYLIGKGFKAQYYFMPDKNASAPPYYKVFLGPYKNESEALIDFKKVVAFNDKAYILKMDQ